MKPEDKVITIEQAQKFKELGIEIESEKYWINVEDYEGNTRWEIADCSVVHHNEDGCCWLNDLGTDCFPAPDVAELGEIELIPILLLCYKLSNKMWLIEIFRHGDCIYSIGEETEAQAKGAAVIWLKENGHLEGK